MKKIITFLSLVVAVNYSLCQTIVRGEYFFDSDPGIGAASALNVPTNDFENLTSLISIDGLSTGFHTVCFRFLNDSSDWGHQTCRSMYVMPISDVADNPIVGGEYFIDADPGMGLGQSLGTFIPTDSLPLTGFELPGFEVDTYGFHTVCFRFLDLTGHWSHSTCRSFIYQPPSAIDGPITYGEYFFDADPGIGNGLDILFTPIDSLFFANAPLELPDTLDYGFHTVCFRFQNENGEWSHSTCRSLYFQPQSVVDGPIVEGEYFVDADPGIGFGSPISVSANNPLDLENFPLSLSDTLSIGFHTVCFRFKNENGEWSHSTCRSFIIQPEINTEPKIIVAAEYFFDSPDPGQGLATSLNNLPMIGDSIDFSNLPIALDALPIGSHTMTIRFLDNYGSWSHNHTEPFTICAEPGPPIFVDGGIDYNQAGLTVYFQPITLHGETYVWHFGDNLSATSNGGIVSHTYSTPDEYTVELVASNLACGTASITTTIYVTDAINDLELTCTPLQSGCDLTNSDTLFFNIDNVGANTQNDIGLLLNINGDITNIANDISLIGGQDTSLYITLDLSADGMYVVNLHAVIENEESDGNNDFNFVVTNYAPFDGPADFGSNMQPADGTIDLYPPFSFTWSGITNADHYRLWLYPAASEPEIALTTDDINLPFSQPLFYNTQYSWFVEAIDFCGNSVFSDTLQFSTPPQPDLEILSQIDIPENITGGANIAVAWEVTNTGLGHSGYDSWYDYVYISGDEEINAGDYLAAMVQRPYPLAALESYTSTASFIVPASLCNYTADKYFLVQTDAIPNIIEANDANNTNSSSIALIDCPDAPDLIPQITNIPDILGNIFPGVTDAIEWTVMNSDIDNEDETAFAPWFDRIYISQSPILNVIQAIVLGTYQHTSDLLADSSIAVGMDITIPLTLNSGQYYFHIAADFSNLVYEGEFQNNGNIATMGPFTVLGLPQPDLNYVQIDTASLSDTVSNAQLFPVEWMVENSGITFEDNWNDRVTISSDMNGNNLLSVLSVPVNDSLGNQETYNSSGNITAPQSSNGWHYITVCADGSNQVDETSEDNNCSLDSIFVISPDLQPTYVYTNVTNITGSTVIPIEWQITNNGPGDVFEQWQNMFVLSDNQIYDGTGSYFSPQSGAPALIFGDTIDFISNITIPNLASGTYYLHLITNSTNNVFENGLTANNVISFSTPINITQVVTPLSNLIPVGPLVYTGEAVQGNSLTIDITVQNIGVGNAIGTWTDGLYQSNNPTFGGNPTLIDFNEQIQYVGATTGAYSQTMDFTIQPSFPNPFYLHFKTDAGSTLAESNNDDNVISIGPIAYEELADVYTFDLDAMSAVIGPQFDQDYVFSWTVGNDGNSEGTSDYWRDGLYLSIDQIYDVSDVMITDWLITNSVSPGGQYTRTEYVQLPQGIGTYFLILASDHDSTTTDLDYQNNWQLVGSVGNDDDPIEIDLPPPPDLDIVSSTCPTQLVAGQPVSASFTVQNQGEAIVSGSHADAFYLSVDNSYSGNDLELASTINSDSLATGQSYSISLTGFVPMNYSGYYYLIHRTDKNNSRVEISELNNTAYCLVNVSSQPESDLLVTQIIAPDTIYIGDQFNLTWYRANVGEFDALGYLQDAVFISEDDVFSQDDQFLTVVQDTIGIPAQDTLMQSVNLLFDLNYIGDYYFIIRTDILNNINESNEDNNTTSTFVTSHVTIPILPLQVHITDTLILEQPLYYQFIVDAEHVGDMIGFSLTGTDPLASNELYISFGELPTRYDSEFEFDNPFEENQFVIVPDAQEGIYYILYYSQNSDPIDQQVDLYAEILPFSLTSISANEGGNTGTVTVLLTGTRFEPTMNIRLENESGQIPTMAIANVTPTSAFVTFNLNGANLGLYDVIGNNSNGDDDTLYNAFTIVEGTLGNDFLQLSCSSGTASGIILDGEDILDLQYIHQLWTRPNRIVPITLQMENVGNVDVPVPTRFVISMEGAPISFEEDDFTQQLTELYLVFREVDGPENILRPGGISQVTFYAKAIQPLQFTLID